MERPVMTSGLVLAAVLATTLEHEQNPMLLAILEREGGSPR
ncbi:MAG TPA: hypothetical protein VK911_13265 [Vicinamibacterales bacterium]|nr:hypothetical protein [Vicinamibacterales bacterium]